MRATHAGATARLDSAVATYNATVLAAIREAADSATLLAALDHDLSMQRETISGVAELRRLGGVRVESGLGSKLDLIDPDMQLLAAHRQMHDLEADQAVARIRLLVALGGGFDAAALPATTQNVATAAQGTQE